jgi:hypothetical protein
MQVDVELPARIEMRPVVAQPQIPVRHVCNAAPPASDWPEHLPQLLLRALVAVFRHAARKQVVDRGYTVADQLGEPDEAGKDVQGLEACNGWTFWHVETPRGLTSIDALRAQMRAERAIAAE